MSSSDESTSTGAYYNRSSQSTISSSVGLPRGSPSGYPWYRMVSDDDVEREAEEVRHSPIRIPDASADDVLSLEGGGEDDMDTDVVQSPGQASVTGDETVEETEDDGMEFTDGEGEPMEVTDTENPPTAYAATPEVSLAHISSSSSEDEGERTAIPAPAPGTLPFYYVRRRLRGRAARPPLSPYRPLIPFTATDRHAARTPASSVPETPLLLPPPETVPAVYQEMLTDAGISTGPRATTPLPRRATSTVVMLGAADGCVTTRLNRLEDAVEALGEEYNEVQDKLEALAKKSPVRDETVLTVCVTRLRGQLLTVLDQMESMPNTRLEEIESLMTRWGVEPLVETGGLEAPVDDPVADLDKRFRAACHDTDVRLRDSQARELVVERRLAELEKELHQRREGTS